MCLSVPLSTIQTFPLFLSFGIFFYFSPCRILGFEGSGSSPGSGGTWGPVHGCGLGSAWGLEAGGCSLLSWFGLPGL